MEKVKEPDDIGNKHCLRCDSDYCIDCIDFHEVTFDIEENAYENRPDLKPFMVNQKGEEVCPWCFNQLIDLYNKQTGA